MRTYSQSETDLAFQWVDKYFKLVELIIEIANDEEEDIPLCAPSSESEQKFQELRHWFFAHKINLCPSGPNSGVISSL